MTNSRYWCHKYHGNSFITGIGTRNRKLIHTVLRSGFNNINYIIVKVLSYMYIILSQGIRAQTVTPFVESIDFYYTCRQLFLNSIRQCMWWGGVGGTLSTLETHCKSTM